MKRFLKIGAKSLSVVLLLLAAYIGLLAYPGILFADSIEHNNLAMHSNGDLTGAEEILGKIERALETTPLYDPSLSHDIYFGEGNRPFTILQDFTMTIISAAIGRQGSSPSYNLSSPPYVSQIITFYRPIVASDSLVHPDGSNRVNQSLSRTLAHEVVHTLLRQELGLKSVATAPMWKQEGYADYVAASATILADPSYRIERSVERILNQD